MFATLAGGYPRTAMPPAEVLGQVVGAQVEAGLGLISDGLVHPASEPTAELVAAWRATRDAVEARAPGLPAKLAVAGPWTSGGAAGAHDAATELRASLEALADAGCPLVEIHEPAAAQPAAALPADAAGRATFAAAHATLLYGIAERIHACLAITGGEATPLGIEVLLAAPYRSYLLDLLDGPDGWRLAAAVPGERGIVVGVGDAAGRRRTRLEDVVWAAGYAASTGGRGSARVGLAPSGGLEALAPDQARAVIDLLGEAARTLAAGKEATLGRLDPRAIDARSAALGRYVPPRRPRR